MFRCIQYLHRSQYVRALHMCPLTKPEKGKKLLMKVNAANESVCTFWARVLAFEQVSQACIHGVKYKKLSDCNELCFFYTT